MTSTYTESRDKRIEEKLGGLLEFFITVGHTDIPGSRDMKATPAFSG